MDDKDMDATYGKLKDGSWGLRVDGVPGIGGEVTVTKRDGTTKVEVVGSILWSGITKSGKPGALCTIAGARKEPLSFDGSPAIRGQHWSSGSRGPTERLCAGGCGRRVSAKYAECYSCHQESVAAM